MIRLEPALPALTELLKSKNLTYTEKSACNEIIKELSRERRNQSIFDWNLIL